MFIPDPRLATRQNVQICDGMIVAGDSLVLLEYKSSMFRADNKYSGDFSSLADEIEKKLVYDTEADRKKGVWQLAEAVQQLFSRGEHVAPTNVDLGRVKRVYLYIVTLDSIGSTIGMSPFLNDFLSTKLNATAFPSQEIRPLFCSDIEALENITGLFAVRTLPELLESWYQTNPSLTTPLSAIDFGSLPWRTNEWLQDEWTSIYKTVITILFPRQKSRYRCSGSHCSRSSHGTSSTRIP